MPELISSGDPIYLPLDDISGAALVSTFALVQWHGTFAEHIAGGNIERVNVCWGLKEGSSGLIVATQGNVADADAADVRNPSDPEGWHPLFDVHGPGFRRARRIDVTFDQAGFIRVDAAFQDSANRRDLSRVAIHEYNLVVTADPETLEILTLEPEPLILPFPECPGAIANAKRLVGSRLSNVRDSVVTHLRGPKGCTHLNDAMRALAEVPKLAQDLVHASR